VLVFFQLFCPLPYPATFPELSYQTHSEHLPCYRTLDGEAIRLGRGYDYSEPTLATSPQEEYSKQ